MRCLLFPALALVGLCGSSPSSPAQDRPQLRVSGIHSNQRVNATALVPVGLTHAATAPAISHQKFFPTDATIGHSIDGSAEVGYAVESVSDSIRRPNPKSPVVSLIRGNIRYYVHVYNASTMTVSGGSIGGSLAARNQSTVTVSGGRMEGGMLARDNSAIHVSGGRIVSVLQMEDSSFLAFSGGSIWGNLLALGHSRVVVSGGTVHKDREVSTALSAENDSIVTISGGSIRGGLSAIGHSVINISGGDIEGGVDAFEESTINLFGTGLCSRLTSANHNGFRQYTLSGRLADGTSVQGKLLYVKNGSRARFTLNNTPRGSQHP